MNQKLVRLSEPSLRLYFVILMFFALISAYFLPWLGLGEGIAVIALFLYLRASNLRRRKELMRYIETMAFSVDTAARDATVYSPLPMVIFRPETGEVIWSNELFLRLIGRQEHLFDTKLEAAVPGFDSRWLMEGKLRAPDEVEVDDRRFLVFGRLVRPEHGGREEYLAATYWVDVTSYSDLREKFFATRPVTAILLLDNYEELMKNTDENARSTMLSEIAKRLNRWTADTQGLLCRYDRDRYLFVFEERFLAKLQEEKFSILDAVHEVQSPGGIPATLSIGIGRDAPSLGELFQFASLSLEMALSRGGDQAVVKNRFNFEFYGGRSKETEKHTKVKSRVMANALGELIADASKVFIMGHKYPDLDTAGAAAGICAIARKRGVAAFILREGGNTPAEVMYKRLGALPEYQNVFIAPDDALVAADSNSLLVVVDTSRPEQVQSEALLESCSQKAVIDHHRRAATYISDATLNFHEPYSSSASELVAELIQYILEPSDLLRAEAEALMAGIMLDTKNFTIRTGGRTFEAAALLRRSGADTSEVRKLFQNNLEGTVARYDIIQNARLYRDSIAIARVEHTVGRVTAAQAADELLNILGIDTSFVLFPDGDKIIISARSLSDTNVQVILEKLGGGGNAATAGVQLANQTMDEAARALIRAIDQYFEGS
jgi:c-di-AMP phosphodiesterase-like protein